MPFKVAINFNNNLLCFVFHVNNYFVNIYPSAPIRRGKSIIAETTENRPIHFPNL